MGLEMLSLHKTVMEKYGQTNSMQGADGRLLAGAGILFIYMLFGAVTFVVLESPLEQIEQETYVEFITQWKARLVTAGIAKDEVDKLFKDIREAARNGIWMIEGNKTNDPNWSFGQAFFFSGTLISTVGYGRISPRTEQGKLFTIIYCIFGIPLTLAMISALVAKLRRPSLWIRRKLEARLGEERAHSNRMQLIHLFVVLLLLAVFIFLIPSFVFTMIEDDWTYLDAFYYCFVSLTTIGLGDFEPGDNAKPPIREVYKVLCTVYLLVGLTCMMLFLATLYDVPQLNISRFFLIDQITDEEQSPIADRNCPSYTRQQDEDVGPAPGPTATSASNNYYTDTDGYQQGGGAQPYQRE